VDLARLLALVHVGSALLYVTGFVSTGTLTELARRTADATERRRLLELSGRFDFWYQIPFGTLVGLSGLAVTAANSIAWTTFWIAASIGVYAAITFSGAFLWRRHSALVRDAVAAGEDARVVGLLMAPSAVLHSWIDRVLMVAIVVLMVVRPT
jgi:Predicted integral membrane protein (DUF2269)